MNKKTLTLLLALILVFSSSACSYLSKNSTKENLSSKSDNNSSSSTYKLSFTQKKDSSIHTIAVGEYTSISIKFSSRVKEGSIAIVLKDDDDKIIFEESGKKISFTDTYNFDEGLYYIVFEYENAQKGNLKLELNSTGYFKYYESANSGSDEVNNK